MRKLKYITMIAFSFFQIEFPAENLLNDFENVSITLNGLSFGNMIRHWRRNYISFVLETVRWVIEICQPILKALLSLSKNISDLMTAFEI